MPNDDLISRKALLEKVFNKRGDFHYFREPPEKVVRATDVINAPAVDAEPVRRGKWENGGDGIYDTCTYCKESIYMALPMNYCPNCGAKMEKST